MIFFQARLKVMVYTGRKTQEKPLIGPLIPKFV